MACRARAVERAQELEALSEAIESAQPSGKVVRPAIGWFILLDGALLKLAVLAFSPKVYNKARDYVPLPEQPVLRRIFYWAIAVHIGEALLARRMANRRNIPAGPWVRQTFVVGFPSLLKLRRL